MTALDDALGFEGERDFIGSAPNSLWRNTSEPPPDDLGNLHWRAWLIPQTSSLWTGEYLSYQLYVSPYAELYVRKVAESGTFWARVPKNARKLVLDTFLGKKKG